VGRAKRCRYFGSKEKTRKKSSDTGTEKEDWNTPRHGKRRRKKHWTPAGYVCSGIKEKIDDVVGYLFVAETVTSEESSC